MANDNHTESEHILKDKRIARGTGHKRHASGKTTTEYISWNGACMRCNNPKSKDYDCYGGRGIEMRFKSFMEFFAYLGPKPYDGATVDRIDTNGHYESGNVRWSSRTSQIRNTRRSVCINIDGKKVQVDDWIESKIGNQTLTVSNRIKSRILNNGWCLDCALKPGKYETCSHRLVVV